MNTTFYPSTLLTMFLEELYILQRKIWLKEKEEELAATQECPASGEMTKNYGPAEKGKHRPKKRRKRQNEHPPFFPTSYVFSREGNRFTEAGKASTGK